MMELEKQAANMMQRLQAGDMRAQAQLEGIFSEVDRIESQVQGIGRNRNARVKNVEASGRVGQQRVPERYQNRNLAQMRAEYNAIRDAPNAGGRSQRRAR